MTIDRINLKALAIAVKSGESPDPFGAVFEYENATNPESILALLAEIERLEDHKRELVNLRETHGFDSWAAALVKIDHLKDEVNALRKDADRYRWLCENFGITKLPCAVERILGGEIYVADGKTSIDSAIDSSMIKEK